MPNQSICDEPAAEKGPSPPAQKRTAEEMARLRARRAARPPLEGDAVEIIRAMRERDCDSCV
jgi:hypothetical protein